MARYLDVVSMIWRISVSLNLNGTKGRFTTDYNVTRRRCWQLQGIVIPPDDSKHPAERISQRW